VIPYGKRHPVVLRWISIKKLSLLITTLSIKMLISIARQRVTISNMLK